MVTSAAVSLRMAEEAESLAVGPRAVRLATRAAISGTNGSVWAPVFWIVLMFVLLVLAELIDDEEGFIPASGGSSRNRSVYGGGGGGVGK
ncbi:MAG: hypothetical protein ACFNKE_07575 [Neisseria elongata]